MIKDDGIVYSIRLMSGSNYPYTALDAHLHGYIINGMKNA